jgi:hypothetical protein
MKKRGKLYGGGNLKDESTAFAGKFPYSRAAILPFDSSLDGKNELVQH